jgi:hypothetical protein
MRKYVRYCYRRMGMYLKTQPFSPKLSKFSNVKVPATTTWHVTA